MAANLSTDPFHFREWVLTYDHGFVRRGLVGTIAQAVSPSGFIRQDVVTAVGVTIGMLLVAVMVAVALRLSDGDVGRGALAVAVMFSAVGFPALGANVARVDHLVMLAGAAAAVTTATSWRGRHLAASGLLAVAVLAHPAAIALVVVWVAAYTLWQAGVRAAVTVVALPAAVTVAGILSSPQVPADVMHAAAMARTDVAFPFQPADVLYWSTTERFAAGMQWAWPANGPIMFFLTAVAALPVGVACWRVAAEQGVRWGRLPIRGRALAAAAAVPMLLSVTAVDYGRWAVFAGLELTVATLLLIRRHGDGTPLGTRGWVAVGAVPVCALVSGPMFVRGFWWAEPLIFGG